MSMGDEDGHAVAWRHLADSHDLFRVHHSFGPVPSLLVKLIPSAILCCSAGSRPSRVVLSVGVTEPLQPLERRDRQVADSWD